jgi:hypothetical protein
VVIDGPPGKYRFLATFEQGAAAAGGEVEFYVSDAAQMPPVDSPATLWGDDPGLARWLSEHGIRTRPYSAAHAAERQVILASAAPSAPGGAAAFADLARRIVQGSTVVFLSPAVFAKEKNPTGWLPLASKGSLTGLPSWLYHKDDWCRRHPIFDGAPCGELMDYAYYREIIPDAAWVGQDAPVEPVAGGINASQGYSSGLYLSVYELGAGRFILNTLRIRENLGGNPAAERLLRNMLRYAARDLAKPPAALPLDFDQRLKAMGY